MRAWWPHKRRGRLVSAPEGHGRAKKLAVDSAAPVLPVRWHKSKRENGGVRGRAKTLESIQATCTVSINAKILDERTVAPIQTTPKLEGAIS